MLIDFASCDIELALWKTPLGEGSIKDMTDISITQEKDVGIDTLRQVLDQVSCRGEAAHMERLQPVDINRGEHCGDFWFLMTKSQERY